jgi:hypothetical protein
VKTLNVADSSRKILVDPDSGRKAMQVTEWQWKILSVANGSRKIVVVDGRL